MSNKIRKIVFIVGNPRSGTTMLGLILGKHQEIHTFHELHYFDKLWDPKDPGKKISKVDASRLELKFRSLEAKDILKNRGREDNEMPDILLTDENDEGNQRAIDTYKKFLFKVTEANNKSIPCEHTPGYLYYVNEIHAILSEAKFINIIRDPRDVLLSQKKKWQSQNLKKDHPTLFEKFRTWVNYHPITTSLVWHAAIKHSFQLSEKRFLHIVKYEDVLEDADKEVRSICGFLQLSFDKEMLNVSRSGSSIKNYGDDEKGVDSTRKSLWLQEGLSSAEIYLCQRINKTHMNRLGYNSIPVKVNPLHLFFCLATFPLKLFSTFVIHIPHYKNLAEAIKRRIM